MPLSTQKKSYWSQLGSALRSGDSVVEIQQYSEDSPRILLVEGQDDAHVVKQLVDRESGVDDFTIVVKDGLPNLLAGLPLEFESDTREVIGIIVDADSDTSRRWHDLQAKLKGQVQLPTSMSVGGAIVDASEGVPRVGVWIMPNNIDAGELEDFIRRMIPETDAIWPRSQQYIEEIVEEFPTSPPRPFRDNKILRAQVHAWLATREAPRRMGQAIGRGDLDATVPVGTEFIGWLRRLFDWKAPSKT